MSLFSLEWWQIALLFLPALLNLWGIWHAFNHTFETPLDRILQLIPFMHWLKLAMRWQVL